MNHNPSDESENDPPLSKLLVWFINPKNSTAILGTLTVICILLLLADFTYNKYGHFAVEKYKGFYAFYGFVMFTGIILAAKSLRFFIQRPEDYYGDSAIDHEDYPPEQLEKVEDSDV